MTDSQKKTTTMTLINIGFGSTLLLSRLIEIVSPDTAMTKRLIAEARGFGQLIDATYGRRTHSVIRMDSGHVVLSTIQPKTVAKRVAAEHGTNA